MTSVEWKLAARDELDAIWSATDEGDQPALEHIVLDLLADLRADPRAVGESRSGSQRVAIRSPLTFWFDVLDDGQLVRIFHVRRKR